MPIAGGQELLRGAVRGGYAVPGFNVSNVEMALGVLDAAEAARAPIFLQFNPSNLEHFGGAGHHRLGQARQPGDVDAV